MFNEQWNIIYLLMIVTNLNSWGKYTHRNVVSKKDKQHIFHQNVGSSDDCNLTQTDTDYPAGVPQDITTTCYCKKETRKCYNEINWKSPKPGMHHVIAYRISFEKVTTPISFCYQVPSNETKFVFNEKSRFDRNFLYYFGVVAQPTKGKVEYNTYTIDCPSSQLYIQRNLPNDYINTGGNYVFNCTFEGNPEPDVIIWYFRPGLTKIQNQTVLHNNKHIKITKGMKTTTLKIVNPIKADEGRYTCYIRNYFGKHDIKYGYLHVHVQKPRKNILGQIIGGVTGGILLLIAIIVISKCFSKSTQPVVVRKQYVYISHCTPDEKKKSKLLKFASHLQLKLCGVTVIIDLTQGNEIHNAGGMSQWVPEQMCKADKILVVLSKDYLKVLEVDESNGHKDETACKIQAEYHNIKTTIYQGCQINDKLIIVSDGVKPEDFPNIFQGRLYYLFPKDTGKGAQHDFVKILDVLSGENILQYNKKTFIQLSIENL